MRHTTRALVGLLLFKSSLLAAQEPTVRATANPQQDGQVPASLLSSDANPRTGLLSGPSVGLAASNDDSTVSLTIAPERNGLLTESGSQSWSLTLKAPLDKDSGSGTFVTETGLSNQFAAEFSYSRIFAKFAPISALSEAAKLKFLTRCKAEAREQPAYALLQAGPQGTPSLEVAQKNFERHYCEEGGDWPGLPVATLRRFLSPAEVAAVKGEEFAQAGEPIKLLNLSGSVGYREFKFLSPTTFVENKKKEMTYAFSISGGYIAGRGQPFFGGGYEYKRDFTEKPKRVVCPAATAGLPTSCPFKVFDAPERDISHNVFALVRIADLFPREEPNKFRLPIALEVRAGYDIHDKILGVSVPVYFLFDDKGGFRGGAKFDWANRSADSKKDEFKFGIFVVKSFDLFHLS